MVQIIFGWRGTEILDLLKQLEYFSENDLKKISNILTFKIETKNIKPPIGINKWTPDIYETEVKDQKSTFITRLYQTKYSAYDKINRMQKYISMINCKYGTNLTLNFNYNPKGYTFILHFGDCSSNDKSLTGSSNMEVDKISEYINIWDRVKSTFSISPKIYTFN